MYIPNETAQKIKSIAQHKKVSVNNMLVDCGLNKNTIFTMQNRGSWIQADRLAIIADYLDVSIDFLMNRTEKEEINK